ncbi:MAG: gluconate 2-dehydrogenase subunit 3 family protein [Bacteroidia bacterium]|nr:gluconate 2-dehydrogenase subunit 3 family protein [Bacteroidia bacterium]
MNRRHLLKGMGVVALYSSFPAVLGEFISSCNSKDKVLRAGFFTDEEFKILEQLTDGLLPKTSTPGALETQVPAFIDQVVKECMGEDDQQLIRKGLQEINEVNGKTFTSLSNDEKNQFIKTLDENAFKDDASSAWFRIVKRLALIGHFTSQRGMTEALNYVKVPGDYKACIPYNKGDKAMAKTFLMYW